MGGAQAALEEEAEDLERKQDKEDTKGGGLGLRSQALVLEGSWEEA